jgi:hypothetical protein
MCLAVAKKCHKNFLVCKLERDFLSNAKKCGKQKRNESKTQIWSFMEFFNQKLTKCESFFHLIIAGSNTRREVI